jgi:hypothetical protein
MVQIRFDFENLRLIYSSLSKREKLKLKYLQNELKLFNANRAEKDMINFE